MPPGLGSEALSSFFGGFFFSGCGACFSSGLGQGLGGNCCGFTGSNVGWGRSSCFGSCGLGGGGWTFAGGGVWTFAGGGGSTFAGGGWTFAGGGGWTFAGGGGLLAGGECCVLANSTFAVRGRSVGRVGGGPWVRSFASTWRRSWLTACSCFTALSSCVSSVFDTG